MIWQRTEKVTTVLSLSVIIDGVTEKLEIVIPDGSGELISIEFLPPISVLNVNQTSLFVVSNNKVIFIYIEGTDIECDTFGTRVHIGEPKCGVNDCRAVQKIKIEHCFFR